MSLLGRLPERAVSLVSVRPNVHMMDPFYHFISFLLTIHHQHHHLGLFLFALGRSNDTTLPRQPVTHKLACGLLLF